MGEVKPPIEDDIDAKLKAEVAGIILEFRRATARLSAEEVSEGLSPEEVGNRSEELVYRLFETFRGAMVRMATTKAVAEAMKRLLHEEVRET